VQPDDDRMTKCAELRDRWERDGVALGQKIHEPDQWIAATALHLGVDLVSDDSVFENIDGLTVLSRSTNPNADRSP
jgi:predicted nucleic acid-binding protein